MIAFDSVFEEALVESREKMPPIVFLDFDGVLNNIDFIRENRANEMWALLDPKAVQRLNQILEQTGAKVVISSSWRQAYSLPQLRTMLETRGFKGQAIGMTSIYKSGWRAHEIQHWVDRYNVDYFVILDDTGYAEVDGHFVRTSTATGLQDGHVRKAVHILGRKRVVSK